MYTPDDPKGGAAQTEEKLTALLAAPCEVRMRQENGRYILFLADLGLSAQHEDLAAAHAELMKLRETRLRQFAQEGVLHWLAEPRRQETPPSGLLAQLKPFLVKSAVTALLIVGTLVLIGRGLDTAGKQLEKNIRGVGSWSPEKIEQERQRAQAFAEKMGPVARELMGMFSSVPGNQTPAETPGKQ
ncbi:hypothetical protein M7784_04615 [Desulfovibrio aminophilus]|nr:hypothetical protein [Desulfovibrio aminophilus]MCM0754527.1 hypothetical protein [Desulfovibrio aminophilus]